MMDQDRADKPATAGGAGDGAAGIALRFFVGHPNIGDAVNPALVRHTLKTPAYFEPDIRSPHLLALGSVLDWATAHSHVWGSGLIDPARGWGALQGRRVWALRGKESWSALKKGGLALRDVPLGDPGILAPELFCAPNSETNKTGPVGLIPHYVDFNDPAVTRLAREDGVKLIDVRQEAHLFFREIGECSAVLSSSLHGLVFAEAMNIPNLWLQLSDNLVGGGFKFHDWFSTTRVPQRAPASIGPRTSLADLRDQCRLHDLAVDRTALELAVPEQVVEELSEKSRFYRAPVIEAYTGQPEIVVFVIARRRAALDEMLQEISAQSIASRAVVILSLQGDEAVRGRVNELGEQGFEVVKIPEWVSDEAFYVEQVIRRYFEFWENCRPFVVCEDLDFAHLFDSSLFERMEQLLRDRSNIMSVGPDIIVPGGPDILATDGSTADNAVKRLTPGVLVQLAPEAPIRSLIMRRPASNADQTKPIVRVARSAREVYANTKLNSFSNMSEELTR